MVGIMDSLSFISLGGVGDVTKNMSAYVFGGEILLVDCGIGFVDESMPGVDLMIPNISYLKSSRKLSEPEWTVFTTLTACYFNFANQEKNTFYE